MTKSNSKRTGTTFAAVYAELAGSRSATFTLDDVREITGLQGGSARSLVHRAEGRGLVTRLKDGLFCLVPSELGWEPDFVEDPLVIVDALAAGRPYFASHASAMEIHRMVTQPALTVYATSTDRIRTSVPVGGYRVHFVTVPEHKFWGHERHWVKPNHAIWVSNPERTILDGLRQPEYVGGITEVAKALWMRRETLSTELLLSYSIRLDVGAVTRRLGYLLELYGMGAERDLLEIRNGLSDTYHRIDPIFPKEGPHDARWRLQLNVSPEELLAVRVG